MRFEQEIANAVRGLRINSAGFIRTTCPLCEEREGTPDRKRSLGLNARTLFWSCWRCNAKGKLPEAPDEYDLPDEEKTEAPEEVEPPEGYYPLAGDRSISLAPARKYLASRRLDVALIERMRIGACAKGFFAGRVIVPVLDSEERWRWYVGRAWTKKHDKPYLYPIGARQGVLYNEAALDVYTKTPVLIVEGVFDALAHYPNAVAVLGKTTDAHVERLAKAHRPVVFVPDGDEWRSGYYFAQKLRQLGRQAGCVRLDAKQDPDEVSQSELLNYANQAIA